MRGDLTDASKVIYPSGSKYMFTRGEVEELRAELERLRAAVRELQDRVGQLEQAGQRKPADLPAAP